MSQFITFCVHTAGVDYISAFAVLTFTDDVREVCLVVVTLEDDSPEGSETFSVFLISTDPTVDVVRSNSTGVILDEGEGKFLQQHSSTVCFYLVQKVLGVPKMCKCS